MTTIRSNLKIALNLIKEASFRSGTASSIRAKMKQHTTIKISKIFAQSFKKAMPKAKNLRLISMIKMIKIKTSTHSMANFKSSL